MTINEVNIEVEAWVFQQEVMDYRFGLLCSVYLEPYRDEKKKPEPWSPQDFMPDRRNRKPEKTVQTWEQQKTLVEMLNALFGGVDARPQKGVV